MNLEVRFEKELEVEELVLSAHEKEIQVLLTANNKLFEAPIAPSVSLIIKEEEKDEVVQPLQVKANQKGFTFTVPSKARARGFIYKLDVRCGVYYGQSANFYVTRRLIRQKLLITGCAIESTRESTSVWISGTFPTDSTYRLEVVPIGAHECAQEYSSFIDGPQMHLLKFYVYPKREMLARIALKVGEQICVVRQSAKLFQSFGSPPASLESPIEATGHTFGTNATYQVCLQDNIDGYALPNRVDAQNEKDLTTRSISSSSKVPESREAKSGSNRLPTSRKRRTTLARSRQQKRPIKPKMDLEDSALQTFVINDESRTHFHQHDELMKSLHAGGVDGERLQAIDRYNPENEAVIDLEGFGETLDTTYTEDFTSWVDE